MKSDVSSLELPVVATIMCVYKNDTASNLELAVNSVLSQRLVSNTLFIFVDGKISDELRNLLFSYRVKRNVFIKFYDNNVGLAFGLNWLLDNLVDLNLYDYIARMDADDISVDYRYHKQIEKLRSVGASIIGTDCIEIDGDGNEVFYKKMSGDDVVMKKDIIKRCPFIHPSVLFDVNVFKDGFRYDSSLMNTQDYYLWVELAFHGYIFSNVNEPLLLFRVNDSFHKRRGLKKAFNEFNGRLFAMKKLKAFSFRNIIFTLSYFILRITPASVSVFAYKNFR